ncbi:transcription factor ETV6-like isoform X2 [Mytilus trossulus]|uniref:transcription factor ETV6-like isoform X2 n=1 Tax=Mytilus trossulus TaxID=6551 RepID=UPI0030061300
MVDCLMKSVMFNIWPSTIYQPPQLSCNGQQTVLPASLAKHPQQWTKHEVGVWLKWCSDEFCIEPIPPDRIDMNGKALCLLKRSDFMERIPKNGDLLFNALQKLIQNKVSLTSPMSSMCSGGATVPMSPFHIKTEPISPLLHPLVFTSANTQTTSMHAPSIPRPCVPILPRTQSTILPPSCSNPINSNKSFSNTVSTVPGILSPASSTVDTESASSDNGSVSDPEGHENDSRPTEPTNERFLPTTIKTEIQHSIQSAFQPLNNNTRPESGTECRLLWEFIHQLLQNPMFSQLVCWESEKELIFRINNPTGLAHMWGKQKNRTNMTYEKLSRALRYYYRMNIIKKVSGKRLTYKFMQQPSTIQKGQRGAKPHNKCDIPLFSSSNRFQYSGLKDEPSEDKTQQKPPPLSPAISEIHHELENHRHLKRHSPTDISKPSGRNSTKYLQSNNLDIENYEHSAYQLGNGEMSNSNFKQLSPNFHIPSTSYEKSKASKLPPLMVRANVTNDVKYSPDVKLNLGVYGMHSPLSFHENNKHHVVNDSLKQQYFEGMTSPTFSRSQFNDDPQDEPEDLSFSPKKQRLDSESNSGKMSPSDEEQQHIPKDEENNILPLLINYKKTAISTNS